MCLAQAIFVIMMEKFLLKVPKVAGKMEQFYKIVVEKSLKGEEETDDDSDPEIVAQKRTKNSLVRSLHRSVWIRRRLNSEFDKALRSILC